MSTNAARPPATISELAERARNHADDRGSIKGYLRLADQLRRDGKEYAEHNDLENAFVSFARAATIVLEKIPNHREYSEVLKPAQRNNLAMNGQEMLDSLGVLKPILLGRYDQWNRRKQGDSDRTPNAQAHAEIPPPDQLSSRLGRMEIRQDYEEDEMTRRLKDEAAAWRNQREGQERSYAYQAPPPRPSPAPAPRAEAVVASAKAAAGIGHLYGPSYQDNGRREEQQSQRQQVDYINRQQGIGDTEQYQVSRPLVTYPNVQTTTMSGISMPVAQAAPQTLPPSFGHPPRRSDDRSPTRLPLQSPIQYDGDSTDSEAPQSSMPRWRHAADGHGGRALKTNYTPPSITTTTPSFQSDSPIHYPQLMTQHQRTQGYAPSLHSVFTPQPTIGSSSILFDQTPQQPLYSNILPHQTAPGSQPPPQPHYPTPPPPDRHQRQPSTLPERIVKSTSGEVSGPGLKTVSVPRDCLNRFLSIAKVNTVMDRETCGLLLGKSKGHKYIVTTLLIPRQHSTSDTCTMDEEELVLMFTEERNLITLGWIHTHPSQSCFMSSVDLHTHSGFQRMLPESFAIVCAPKSNPNFGIFRLTDPPGLKTVLDCDAKEAFHPHPDVPIYTDADRGHVQMKEMPLEIVDLR